MNKNAKHILTTTVKIDIISNFNDMNQSQTLKQKYPQKCNR